MYTITKNVCLTLVCVLMFSSCSKDTDLPEDQVLKTADLVDYVAYSKIELDVLNAVNAHRTEIGLSKLKRVDGITYQALDHNKYMIEKKEISHDNFSKRYVALVNEIGAKSVSENVGSGFSSAGAVVKAWLDSEGHKKNIEGNHTHFGISVTQDANGTNYFTNIFVRR